MSIKEGNLFDFASPETQDSNSQFRIAPQTQSIQRILFNTPLDPLTPATQSNTEMAENDPINDANVSGNPKQDGETNSQLYVVNGLTLKVKRNKVKKFNTALLTKERHCKLKEKERLERRESTNMRLTQRLS